MIPNSLFLCMVIFQTKKIKKAEQLGDILRQAREKQNLALEKASRSLGIAAKYLRALENNCFSTMPGEIYIKSFIKKYAEWLGLKPQPLVAKYLAEKKGWKANKKIHTPVCRFSRFWSAPHFFRQTLALTIVIILLSYLCWQIKGIFQSPALQISSPPEGMVSPEPNLKVAGQTVPETKVQINGEEVINNNQGSFEEQVTLHEGLNVITITAIKKHGQSTTITRNVIYRHQIENR